MRKLAQKKSLTAVRQVCSLINSHQRHPRVLKSYYHVHEVQILHSTSLKSNCFEDFKPRVDLGENPKEKNKRLNKGKSF
jgi:hypothetical protein